MKRIHRIIIVIITAGVFVIFVYRYHNFMNSFFMKFFFKNSFSEEKIDADLLKNSVVSITTLNHTGSGIIIDISEEDIVIASNAHLLENSDEEKQDKVKVTLMSGKEYAAINIGCSREFDIGFCKINKSDLSLEDMDYIRKADIGLEYDMSTEVIHIGINTKSYEPYEDLVITFSGQIIDYEFIPEFYERMIVSKGFSQPGMSGGGLFSLDYKLLGILAGGETVNGESITYSIPAEDLLKAYEELGFCINY